MTQTKVLARPGFTLVELLVVIAIVGVLVALLLPAVQAAREAARRSQCVNQLKQIGLAIAQHHDSRRTYPAGRTSTRQFGVSWAFQLLNYLEESAVHDAHQPNVRVDDAVNARAMRTPVATYFCPTRRSPAADRDFDNDDAPPVVSGSAAGGDYAANAGHQLLVGMDPITREPVRHLNRAEIGPMFTYSAIRASRVTDGLSKTIAAGEKHIPPVPPDLVGGMVHYHIGDTAYFPGDSGRTVLRGSMAGLASGPQDESAEKFGSLHSQIVNFVWLDGHVQPIAYGVNLTIFLRCSAIGDGLPVDFSQI